ncbi:glycine N-methyltransferase-like [Lytechinus variegatus]|uniref:glycine N-methyltransferase-like n=1 Tax=Lytechinus variegatus TaxID=7654 RepID=UPI001BB27478|nr:glycine N-methyltransferase-like [Lytechinus variegatus]
MPGSSILANPFEDKDIIIKFGVKYERSERFKRWMLEQLEGYQCHRILEAACGTGGDSLLLLEKGFHVTSSDDSQQMVNYARQVKKEKQIENWEILKANWLSLRDDLHGLGTFDAVLCVSSSIICLIDETPELALYRQSFENFKSMLKPGGILLIDHRNMDAVIDQGTPVNKLVYYKHNTIANMESQLLTYEGNPFAANISYDMIQEHSDRQDSLLSKGIVERVTIPLQAIRTQKFTSLLKEIFGEDCEYNTFADFKSCGEVDLPAYYQYVFRKST